MAYIAYEEMKNTIYKAFIKAGLSEEDAKLCAITHTESSLEGVYSHGLNRVPRFISFIHDGLVKVDKKMELIKARGAVENYDGQLGIGIINATEAMDRAIALAKEHGIGLVSLRNTTHWMRGGTYAKRAVEAGYIGMNWINTESVLPAWGAKSPSIGNNPFSLGIPREKGAIIIDMAMSQFSYGKLEVYSLAGDTLPIDGGYDEEGNLTRDPDAILKTKRLLPTGYWKGSGLALALDMAAAAMANGNSGSDMDKANSWNCTACSQIFIAMDPYLFAEKDEIQNKWDERIDALHEATAIDEKRPVRYPGEGSQSTREKQLREGILVDESVWAEVKSLAAN